MSVYLCISVTAEQADRLRANGPRRDFDELARAVSGEILFQPAGKRRGRIRDRLFGPHMRHAWSTARRLQRGDTCFIDGEHIAVPLLALLFLWRKRAVKAVALGHLVDRPWKKAMLWLATRLVPGGTLAVHSVGQRDRIKPWVAATWRVQLVPYQVDTQFWHPEHIPLDEPPLVLGVGSEHRDYAPLVEGLRDMPVTVVIAAGSHWARQIARTGERASNVEMLETALPFDQLRTLYARAAIVAVPLEEIANQSGVTVILEAMSMGKPVVVTANEGQRECITGPMVTATGQVDSVATLQRGPNVFGDAADSRATGLYVEPDSPEAIRHAVELLLNDEQLRINTAVAARSAALTHFTLERYTGALAELMVGERVPVEGRA